MDKLNDHKVMYFDGSPAKGRWHGLEKNLSPERRERMGRKDAKANADYILNTIDWEKGETIKIFTHSMGAKYAKGFVDEILNIAIEQNLIINKESQDLIEYEVDLAPYQPTEQEAVEGVNTVAVHHSGDWVAGTNDVPGAINITNDKGGNEAHGINTFSVKEIYSAICFMLLSQGIF